MEGADNGYSWNGYAVNPDDPLPVGAGFTTFITGDGGETILTGGAFGNRNAMLGGQTRTYFHQSANGSDPFQLRVNELQYVANFTAPVPEPETYAMMLAGLGMLGFMARRRRLKAAA